MIRVARTSSSPANRRSLDLHSQPNRFAPLVSCQTVENTVNEKDDNNTIYDSSNDIKLHHTIQHHPEATHNSRPGVNVQKAGCAVTHSVTVVRCTRMT
jgi:hypothetical protein